MPRTSWTDMARYAVACPPAPTAAAFGEIVRSLVDSMSAGIHQLRTLITLRDTLLPPLISGKLRLPEAQEQVEEALM